MKNLGSIFVLTLTVLFFIHCNSNGPAGTGELNGAPCDVVLDAAHGGKDPGAVSPGNALTEKEIVLQLCREIGEKLEADGIRVRLTRQEDCFVSLPERLRRIRKWRPALLLSIHLNTAQNPADRGFVILRRENDRASLALEGCIRRALNGSGALPDHGSRTASSLRILAESGVPAVTVDAGYLSNPQDAGLLAAGAQRSEIAAALAGAVKNWLREK